MCKGINHDNENGRKSFTVKKRYKFYKKNNNIQPKCSDYVNHLSPNYTGTKERKGIEEEKMQATR
jgi:hypothetical protein